MLELAIWCTEERGLLAGNISIATIQPPAWITPAEGGTGFGFSKIGQMARNGNRLVTAQMTGNICGPQCVDMILDTIHPGRISTNIINLRLGPFGTTIDRLAKMLNANGVNATWRVGYGIEKMATATRRGNPLIAHVRLPNGGGHFIVVDGVTTRTGQRVVAIRDPAGGRQYFELATEFSQRISGQAVTLP